MAPLGLANMFPTYVKGVFKKLAVPVDFGKIYRGQPLFGKTKTWRGLLFAMIGGEIAFLLLQWFCTFDGFKNSVVFFDASQLPWWLGFLLGLGAIIGDLIESFVKRRFKKEPSSRWFPWDNIDYLVGGFVVLAFFVDVVWYNYLAILVVGLVLHVLFNLLGYALKIKKEPW